jgi:hypothetical protein
MNCTDFEDRLHAQFGAARFDAAPDLTDHASQCPACRVTLEQFRLLSDSLGVWRDQVPDVDLTDAVVAACQSRKESSLSPVENGEVLVPSRQRAEFTRPTQSASLAGIVARPFPFPAWYRSRRRTIWLSVASLVGMLVFAVALSGLLEVSPPWDGDPQLAQTRDPADVHSTREPGVPVETVSPAADSAPMSPAPMSPAPAGDVYYDLAQRAAGALGEVTAFVMPDSSPPPMSPADVRPTAGAAGWIDGVKHQLRPIGRSLDDAFDFLWEAGQSADSST